MCGFFVLWFWLPIALRVLYEHFVLTLEQPIGVESAYNSFRAQRNAAHIYIYNYPCRRSFVCL